MNDKLRQASGHTFGLKPRRTVPREKLQQVVIPAAGLDCKACCLAAYEIVAHVDGVEQTTASFKDGRITALIDPMRTDRAKLEDAPESAGSNSARSEAERLAGQSPGLTATFFATNRFTR